MFTPLAFCQQNKRYAMCAITKVFLSYILKSAAAVHLGRFSGARLENWLNPLSFWAFPRTRH